MTSAKQTGKLTNERMKSEETKKKIGYENVFPVWYFLTIINGRKIRGSANIVTDTIKLLPIDEQQQ